MKPLIISTAAVLTLTTTSCVSLLPVGQASSPQPTNPSTQNQNVQQEQKNGSLQVLLSGFQPKLSIDGQQIQALSVAGIVQARITVSGFNIPQAISSNVPVVSGKASLNIPSIPIGVRILKAEGLDANGNLVPGAVLYSVATIANGSNQAVITWGNTPQGQVFNQLYAGDLAGNTTFATSASASAVQDLVNNLTSTFGVVHPSLINGTAIAAQIRSANGVIPGPSTSFLVNPAQVFLTIKGLPAGKSISAYLTDPASLATTSVGNGTSQITSITPGAWEIHVDSADFGNTLATMSLAAAATASVTVDYSGTGGIGLDFGSGATSSTVSSTSATSSTQATGSALFNITIQFNQ